MEMSLLQLMKKEDEIVQKYNLAVEKLTDTELKRYLLDFRIAEIEKEVAILNEQLIFVREEIRAYFK